jgi:hypothetical protein
MRPARHWQLPRDDRPLLLLLLLLLLFEPLDTRTGVLQMTVAKERPDNFDG